MQIRAGCNKEMSEREEYLIPKIARNDYESFRGLMNADLPDTYGEWVKLMEWARLENERRQVIVRAIEINFHEFVRYCWARRCAYNIKALENFTIEKAAGRRS
jgi:hypothetical protein